MTGQPGGASPNSTRKSEVFIELGKTSGFIVVLGVVNVVMGQQISCAMNTTDC